MSSVRFQRDGRTKRSRISDEQFIAILEELETELPTAEACREEALKVRPLHC